MCSTMTAAIMNVNIKLDAETQEPKAATPTQMIRTGAPDRTEVAVGVSTTLRGSQFRPSRLVPHTSRNHTSRHIQPTTRPLRIKCQHNPIVIRFAPISQAPQR